MITLIQHPSRKRALLATLCFSLFLHFIGTLAVKYLPLFRLVYSLHGIEFVEQDFDKRILVTFTKRLSYPPGYSGFRPSKKQLTPEEIKRLEARRQALAAQREAAARRRQEEEAKEAAKEAELAAKREAEAKAQTIAQASATPTPSPTPKSEYPGGFGKINTSPIKAQVQRLYDAKQEGKLVLPEGKLRVGVTGTIRADGTLANYKLIIPSGLPEIDKAALAILDAVSESRALGPLHEITSLSMILSVDERAELSVVGFTANEQAAANIVNLANAALLYARIKKADEPAAMLMINHLKVSRTGQRVQALISMPRQKASDSLAQTMAK
ncbi:MAG: hypothetical protein HY011_29830 [Acidobacteria bacterium]|nr:hypothetical protein [Acidobacteriota bacterium]